MDKKTYARYKNAYQITINGCGNNCLTCDRNNCLCDSKQVRQDAKKWMKQKERERKFYHDNRERRLQMSKDYYNNVRKSISGKKYRCLSKDILSGLPDEFTYEMACKSWLVTYPCARERVNIFIRVGLLEKKKINNLVICVKLEK